jgi:hypothetical protein
MQDMFRPLLCYHQVSVSVTVLNLYPIWINILGCLHSVQYHRMHNDSSSLSSIVFQVVHNSESLDASVILSST